ncbi:MAG: iron-containing redox enzyme family protein [Nitrosomonadales bacterium]|nr:iron-containing redox enzyme family protein [Nitrosomonadales bacterium]
MAFYEELQQATAAERNALLSVPIIGRALQGKVTRDEYIAFLTQAYHHVKHTSPLLMTCGGRVPESHEWIRVALAHYIEEEIGHQDWILSDITACGGDAEAARRSQPNLPTELMVAYAYDTIMRKNPCGFFGMVFVLEGTSIQLATHAAGIIKQTLGLPDNAFSYLTSHGSLDLEHIDFFESVVNRLTEEEDKQAVIHCAKVFFHLYANIFRSLEATA